MPDHLRTVATADRQLNGGDVDGYITTLYHPDCRFDGFPDEFGSDRDGIRAFFQALVAAVPDARIAAEDVVTDGDLVAVRFTLTGSHEGTLLGAEATGRQLNVGGITMLRFDGTQVVERWNRLDDVALMQQLGLLPLAPVA